MKTKEMIELIQSEIIWCLDHPDETLSHDAQFGFMNGLRQAQYIIRGTKRTTHEKNNNEQPKAIPIPR